MVRKGFDCELVRMVRVPCLWPVIASGNMGSPKHLMDVVRRGYVGAVAMVDILYYNRSTIHAIRVAAREFGTVVRESALFIKGMVCRSLIMPYEIKK